MIALEIETEAEAWAAVADLDGLCARAAAAALAVLPDAPPDALAATLLFADDAAVRDLNRAFRGQDKPTNVLSFPAPPVPATAGRARPLGDIALAFETVAREAADEGKSVGDHAAHLVIHGLLHLLGHDHGSDGEADEMERLEVAALARLGIADPYGLAA